MVRSISVELAVIVECSVSGVIVTVMKTVAAGSQADEDTEIPSTMEVPKTPVETGRVATDITLSTDSGVELGLPYGRVQGPAPSPDSPHISEDGEGVELESTSDSMTEWIMGGMMVTELGETAATETIVVLAGLPRRVVMLAVAVTVMVVLTTRVLKALGRGTRRNVSTIHASGASQVGSNLQGRGSVSAGGNLDDDVVLHQVVEGVVKDTGETVQVTVATNTDLGEINVRGEGFLMVDLLVVCDNQCEQR